METKITELTKITTHRTETTGKFTLSDRTTIIESQETMALEVSSDSDTHSMVSVDTSTNMNSITNDWITNMMETSVSNMDTTENTSKIFYFVLTLKSIIVLLIFFTC